jgi:CRISPR/Cas system CSM-associated protein Csm3 (group 7 of RAMP superfamily)
MITNSRITTAILFLILIIFKTNAQKMDEEKTVIEAVNKFAKAADERDEKALDEVLDNSFRLALNQMFGSAEVATIDKKTYLEKIKAKQFGGDKREVSIENVDITKNNATIKVIFKGSKFTISTYLQLAKSSAGVWKIANDLPSLL